MDLFKLAHLPGHVLHHFCSFPCFSSAIIALWKCGDRHLNRKLSEWADTVILEDYTSCSTSRWPKMLTSLTNLRNLEISRSIALAPPKAFSNEIHNLSSCLVTLRIAADLSFTAFLDFSAPQNAHINFGEKPVKLVYACWWNIDAKFPNLRSLTLERQFDFLGDSILGDSFLAVLPRGLQHLHLIHATLDNDCTGISLPPTLESLHVIKMPSTLSLPPTLLSLVVTHKIFVSLPEYDAYWQENTRKHTEAFIERLPRGLTTLPRMVTSDAIKMSHLFPPSITALSLASSQLTYNRTLSEYNWIPKMLVKIEADGLLITPELLLALPPTVTSMGRMILNWTLLRPHAEASKVNSSISLFPPNLRRLHLTRNEQDGHTDHWEATDITYLPNTITYLNMLHAKQVAELQPHSLAREFQGHIDWKLEYLPYIDNLNIFCGSLSLPEGCWSHLKILTMKIQLSSFLALKHFSTLPISDLSLEFSSNITHEIIDHIQLFSLLPPKLYALALYFDKIFVEWNPNAWKLLNTALKTLTIKYRSNLKKDNWTFPGFIVLPHLPPNLRSVMLQLTSITEEDLLQMPCRHKVRFLNLGVNDYYGKHDSCPDYLKTQVMIDAFPVNAFVFTTSLDPNTPMGKKMQSLKERSKMYPDSRVTERFLAQ